MKQLNRFAALALTVLLLFSLAACSKTGSSQSAGTEASPAGETGLPVLYLDGKAYPVTAEDGIKGLEQVHNGVISIQGFDQVYNKEHDMYITNYKYTFFHADGTREEDYQGERKIGLYWYTPRAYEDQNTGTVYPEIVITKSGLPFSDERVADEEAFRALMERSGFSPYQDTYRRYYSEAGPIDTSTQDFEDAIRERIRSDRSYRYEIEKNPELLEQVLQNNRETWVHNTADDLLRQELLEGRSRIVCFVVTEYDQETGEVTTSVQLVAKEEDINSWYSRWSPVFGEEIRPF